MKVRNKRPDNQIVTRPIEQSRQGWAESLRATGSLGDDRLFDKESTNQSSWDQDEWQW
jgi:hypothetical protein